MAPRRPCQAKSGRIGVKPLCNNRLSAVQKKEKAPEPDKTDMGWGSDPPQAEVGWGVEQCVPAEGAALRQQIDGPCPVHQASVQAPLHLPRLLQQRVYHLAPQAGRPQCLVRHAQRDLAG